MGAPVSLAFRIAASLDDLRSNLKDATSQIETTASAMTKMANSLDGSKLIADANAMVKAINDIGGASNLTEAEQAKVNATVTTAIEKYEALGQTAPAAMRELADATKASGGYVEDLGNEITAIGTGFLGAAAVVGTAREAFGALTEFIKGSVDAYAEAESAERRLTVAVQTQGYAIPGLVDQYKALGETYQQTTAYSHVAIEGAEALFVQLGNVGPDMMDKALKAATDLSSGLGIDLDKAVTMVSKAFEGHTTALGRYGIVIDQARAKTEGMTYVLDAIEAKVGGQAQAELDTYAGKVKQLGNAWDDLKEKVGGVIANDPTLQAMLRDATQGSEAAAKGGESFFNAWTLVQGAMPEWMLALKGFHDDLNQAAEVTNTLADAAQRMATIPPPKQFTMPDVKGINSQLDASTGSAQLIADLQEQWKKEAEEAKKAAQAFENAVKTMEASISGSNVALKIRELQAALTGLGGVSDLTQPQLQRLGDEAAKLFKEGGELTPTLLGVAIAFNGLLPPIKDGVQGMQDLGEKIGKITLPAMVAIDEEIDKLSAKIKVGDIGQFGVKISDGFKEGAKAIEDNIKQTERDIAELAHAFDTLGSAIGGDIGHIVTDIGHMVTAIESAKKSFSDASDAFTHGNILGGISAAASGIAGLISVAIDAGKAIEGLWNHFFGTAGRDAVVNFANSFGGFDNLHAQLNQLGAAGEQMWIKLTQQTGRNDLAGAQATIQQITTALNNLTSAQNTQVSGLISKIQALGGSIPAALDPYIQKLQQAGKLTAANAAALQALEGNGKPTYDQLTQLQQKYNLTAAEMGSSFQTQQIDANFQTLIDDLDELTRGGVDVTSAMFDATGALTGLGKATQDDIEAAVKAGVDIPENLKAAAEALIKQGDLVDANGKKITDINQLKFGETMQTSLDNLNKTLELLIATMTGTDPNSLLGALNTIGNVVVHPTIQPRYDDSGIPTNDRATTPPGGVYGGAQAAGGDYYVTRPTWFLAGEKPGGEYASFSGVGRKPSAGSGGGDTYIVNISAIDGASVQQIVQSPKFAESFTRAVKQNLNGMGTELRQATAA